MLIIRSITITLLFLAQSGGEKMPTDVRACYHDLPLAYLPVTQSHLQGREDNDENRDLALSYHNQEKDYLRVISKTTNLSGHLQYYKGEDFNVVAVEHSYCASGQCDNSFVVLSKEDGTWQDKTEEVLKDFDLNLNKIRREIKKAFKETYGSLEFYEINNYDEDEDLANGLAWKINDSESHILLRETSLPYTLAEYAWNKSKNEFEEIKK